jgi:arginine repressor
MTVTNPSAPSEQPLQKTDHVRAYLAQNPKTTAREVVEALAAKGIKISQSLVGFVRTKEKIAKAKSRREQKTTDSKSPDTATVAVPVSGGPQLIAKIKSLAREAGGIHELKKWVDSLAD